MSSYEIHIENITIDLVESFKRGLLKVKKINSNKLHIDLSFPQVEYIETLSEEDRDYHFDVITGIKEGNISYL